MAGYNEHIQVFIPENLGDKEFQIIRNLWESEYPAVLVYEDDRAFKNYLAALTEVYHYLLPFEGMYVWAMVFKRNEETWFALIADKRLQGKGYGRLMMQYIKGEHSVLNGWVIDREDHVKKNGETYRSPLEFYRKNNFVVQQDVCLNTPKFNAVKISWQAEPTSYLFTSAHLGFRPWRFSDHAEMAVISSDEIVMEYFPSIQDRTYVLDFVKRMKKEYAEKGFCYFAVDHLGTAELIGFIGIHEQTFEADFTPCFDIGWRLKKSVWNQGYATEGANRCLAYAFKVLGIKEVYSMTPKVNVKSQRIMQKIGMQYVKTFTMALLKDDERLKECVLYSITRMP